MSNLATTLPTSLLRAISFANPAFQQEVSRRDARHAALLRQLSHMAKVGTDLRVMVEAARGMELAFSLALGLVVAMVASGLLVWAGLSPYGAPLFFIAGLLAGLYFIGKSADETERFAQSLADSTAPIQPRK